jgi:hypothetical protein
MGFIQFSRVLALALLMEGSPFYTGMLSVFITCLQETSILNPVIELFCKGIALAFQIFV